MIAKRGVSRWRDFSPAQQRARVSVEQRVGQIGQVIGQGFHRQLARHVLRQQAQGLHLLEAAQRIHLRFGVAGMGVEFVVQLGGTPRPVGHAQQVLRRDQFVQQLRLARQHLRRPGARRQQPHQLQQGRRIFGQQRQIGGAACDRLHQRGKALQRGRPDRAGRR